MKRVVKKRTTNWSTYWQSFISDMGQIVERFGKLLKVILDFKAIATFLLTVGLLIYSQGQIGQTRLVFEVVGLLTTSIVAGIVTQNWIELQGNTYIIKKSGGAIRNLRLIKFKIKNISKRLSTLRDKGNSRNFDEVNNLVTNVEQDILNSILDWADVNPDSELLVDYFETIRVREEKVITLETEKKQLEERMGKLDKDKAQLSSRLQTQIDEKIKQISELNAQISNQNLKGINIASGTISGYVSGASLSPSLSPSGLKDFTVGGYVSTLTNCPKCGNLTTIADQYNSNLSTQGYCAECRKIGNSS